MTEDTFKPARLVELLLAFVVILSTILFQVASTRSWVLFTRPLWIDEVFTQIVTSAPDVRTLIGSLYHGVEVHLPTTYFLWRLFCLPFGGVTPVALRCFALLSIIVGLTGFYAVLRLRFDRPVAAIGTLAVWSDHYIVYHAFDGRFYGPMLAETVWFAYFLFRSRGEDRPSLFRIAAGGVAVLLCTSHYFGCLNIALIMLADWVLLRRGVATIRRDIVTLLPASIALLACAPLYFAQRHALRLDTWLERATASDLNHFLRSQFAPLTVMAVLIPWCLGQFWQGGDVRSKAAGDSARPLAGLVGLTFFCVPIVLITLLKQNVLLPRYTINTVVGIALPLTCLIAQTSKILRGVTAVGLFGLSTISIVGLATTHRNWQHEASARIDLLRRLPADTLAVFADPAELFCYHAAARDLGDRLCVADFSLDPDQPLSKKDAFLINIAQNFNSCYGRPRVASRQELLKAGALDIVGAAGKELNEAKLLTEFPGFQAQSLRPLDVILTKQDAARHP